MSATATTTTNKQDRLHIGVFKMARRQSQHDEERAYYSDNKANDKEDSSKRAAAEMDELGSEVFTLKLALQEYEDRLAKLYQTEDRSQWKGPATLLVSVSNKGESFYVAASSKTREKPGFAGARRNKYIRNRGPKKTALFVASCVWTRPGGDMGGGVMLGGFSCAGG